MFRRVLGCAAVLWIAACGKVKSDVDAPAGGEGNRVCAVGETTACSQNNLITCDANGQQISSEPCALGCVAMDATARCSKVDPSNGLATALDNAAQAPDLVLMGTATIDTDAGTVTDQSGARTPPTTTLSGGPVGVFVIEAKTFVAGKVTVTGTHALAIVSAGDVQINGVFALDATGFGISGAGAITSVQDVGVGGDAPPGNSHGGAGGGGGGFGTRGGTGGNGGSPTVAGAPGGMTSGTIELVPLRGGSPGGRSSARPTNFISGGGGGAIQIVSNTSIAVADSAFLSANGGGGVGPSQVSLCLAGTPCGIGEAGGSGGGILLEAPAITVAANGGIVANGGGGMCGVFGAGSSGLLNATPAPGQQCGGDTGSGGNGGAGTVGALNGASGTGTNPVGGGGGGGAGRIRINVPLGTTFAPAGTVSPSASVGMLKTR